MLAIFPRGDGQRCASLRAVQAKAFASHNVEGQHGGLEAIVNLQLHAVGPRAIPFYLYDIALGNGGAIHVECHSFLHTGGLEAGFAEKVEHITFVGFNAGLVEGVDAESISADTTGELKEID